MKNNTDKKPAFATFKDKLYQEVQTGPWYAVEEVKLAKYQSEPRHRWAGHSLPITLVREVLAFFAWTQDEFKSESLITLMYHEDEGWRAAVFPQEAAGMTVKLLPDHENRIPTFQRFGKGWSIMGTWHHHCTAGAFASGTDQSDEKTKEGLHLTSGNLDKRVWSLHSRVSFRGTVTAAALEDWFDCDADVAPHLRPGQIEWELCQAPTKDDTFPDWWKENMVKPEPVSYTGGQGIGNYVAPGSTSSIWMQGPNGSYRPREEAGKKFLSIIARNIHDGKVTIEDVDEWFKSCSTLDEFMFNAMMNGNLTIAEAEEALVEEMHNDAPTEAELVEDDHIVTQRALALGDGAPQADRDYYGE